MNADTILINATHLTFRYDKTPVLHDVSLTLYANELLGVVGANGAGKSTLLRLLIGLATPNEGRVIVQGKATTELSHHELARYCAWVPQSATLDIPLRVREFVSLGRVPYISRFRGETDTDRQAIQSAIERTNLVAVTRRWLSELSGGERQRALLARAFAQQTTIIAMDEPNTHLDVKHAHDLIAIARESLSPQSAVIAVFHDLSLAARSCDRIALMKDGQITHIGTPDAVFTPDNLESTFGVTCTIIKDDASQNIYVGVT